MRYQNGDTDATENAAENLPFFRQAQKQAGKDTVLPCNHCEGAGWFWKTTVIREFLKDHQLDDDGEYWCTCLGQSASIVWNSICSALSNINHRAAENLKELGIPRLDSAEQTTAIEHIKIGLSQVSNVVQTNVATAEENSATSEEMSVQADMLRQEVARFKLKTGHANEFDA